MSFPRHFVTCWFWKRCDGVFRWFNEIQEHVLLGALPLNEGGSPPALSTLLAVTHHFQGTCASLRRRAFLLLCR